MSKKLKLQALGIFIILKVSLFAILMLVSAPFFMVMGDSTALLNGLRSAMNMASELVEIGYITQSEFDEFERSVFK